MILAYYYYYYYNNTITTISSSITKTASTLWVGRGRGSVRDPNISGSWFSKYFNSDFT